MAVRSAVIFVPDDTGKTGYERPMFLQRIMGVPMLSWLVQSLLASGVSRYFLVCLDAHRAEAKNCFPAEAELIVASDAEAADLMHVFLSTRLPRVYPLSNSRRASAAGSSCIPQCSVMAAACSWAWGTVRSTAASADMICTRVRPWARS